jgi:hypothetical protein
MQARGSLLVLPYDGPGHTSAARLSFPPGCRGPNPSSPINSPTPPLPPSPPLSRYVISPLPQNFVTADATSHWLLGVQLIALYCVVAIAYFYQADPKQPAPEPN